MRPSGLEPISLEGIHCKPLVAREGDDSGWREICDRLLSVIDDHSNHSNLVQRLEAGYSLRRYPTTWIWAQAIVERH